jgi:hypothetical protein
MCPRALDASSHQLAEKDGGALGEPCPGAHGLNKSLLFSWGVFSGLLISTASFVCAESVSAGVGLRSAFWVSMDPLQLINVMVSSVAIILNFRQVGSCPDRKMPLKVATQGWPEPQTRCALMRLVE